MRIESCVVDLGAFLDHDLWVESVPKEPMLFGADLGFALKHGGTLTRKFIGCLPERTRLDSSLLIDSRTQMMMPGWFGCIPGWHLDHVPRGGGHNQPLLDEAHRSEAEHWTCVVGEAPTEFVRGAVEFHAPEERVYEALHRRVEEGVYERDVGVVQSESGHLYQFDSYCIHRGVPAHKSGWRWFARASVATGRTPANEVRIQTQIYLPSEKAGW